MRFKLAVLFTIALVAAAAALIYARPKQDQVNSDSAHDMTPPTVENPEATRFTLADPPELIDPLDQLQPRPLATFHAEKELITAAFTEEAAIASANELWSWIQAHTSADSEFQEKAQRLRQMSEEILARWPDSARKPHLLYLKLRCAEFFPVTNAAGDELWTYALAQATADGLPADEIAANEIQRAYSARHGTFVMAYAQALSQHAPLSNGAYRGQFFAGKACQFLLKRYADARLAYLEAAKSKEERVRIEAKSCLITLTQAVLDYEKIAQAAGMLLEEPGLAPDKAADALAFKAEAHFKLKQYDAALQDARRLLKLYPGSSRTADARKIESAVQKLVFEQQLDPLK